MSQRSMSIDASRELVYLYDERHNPHRSRCYAVVSARDRLSDLTRFVELLGA